MCTISFKFISHFVVAFGKHNKLCAVASNYGWMNVIAFNAMVLHIFKFECVMLRRNFDSIFLQIVCVVAKMFYAQRKMENYICLLYRSDVEWEMVKESTKSKSHFPTVCNVMLCPQFKVVFG